MSKPRLKYVACHRGTAVMDLVCTPRRFLAPIKDGPLRGCRVFRTPNAAGKCNTVLIRQGLGNDRFALEFRPVIKVDL